MKDTVRSVLLSRPRRSRRRRRNAGTVAIAAATARLSRIRLCFPGSSPSANGFVYLYAFLWLGFADPDTIVRGTDQYISGLPQDRIRVGRISASTPFTDHIPPRVWSDGQCPMQ